MAVHAVIPNIHFVVSTDDLDSNQRLAAVHAISAELAEMDPHAALRTTWIYNTELCPTDENWGIAEADIRRALSAQLSRFDKMTTRYTIDIQNAGGHYIYKYVDSMFICCRGYAVLENGKPKLIPVPGVGDLPLEIVFEAAGPVG